MRFFHRLTMSCIVTGLLAAVFMLPMPALAEGSRTLYPDPPSGSRANLEWANTFYGPGNLIARRTILNVYAELGEVILMGSSAVGVGQGNILVYPPGQITGPIGNEVLGTPVYDCQAQRTASGIADQGMITSRAMELAGPDTVPNSIANAYEPCFFTVPATGIYHVIFYGPGGANTTGGTPSGQVNIGDSITNPANFNATQGSTVTAWDVTVRSSLASTVDLTGRVFANYLSLFTGGNGRPVNSTAYTVTLDGYIYRTDLRGLDPNGFVVFGNQLGFLDSDGVTPLYRDVLSDALNTPQMSSLWGGVTMQRPQFPIFFSDPRLTPASTNAIFGLRGIPTTPVAPIASNLSFAGSAGGSTSLIGTGGTFSFTSNTAAVYELIISRDGVDFDPTNPLNRVLRGNNPAGTFAVNWNGMDNAGAPFPVGVNYPVRLVIRAGEYHFPMLDAENSTNGGPSYTLLNPPAGCPPFIGACSAGFYDDRGYVTQNGTSVGTLNVVHCGNNPPAVSVSDLLNGFNTTSNQRGFGAAAGGNTNNPCQFGAPIGAFGDVKGLDLWTYYPSNIATTALSIVDTLPPAPAPASAAASSATAPMPAIAKTVDPPFAQPGDTVTWTITLTNTGSAATNALLMEDSLPPSLNIVSVQTSAGSVTISSNVVRFTGPPLSSGQSVRITVTTRVRDDVQLPFILRNAACLADAAGTPLRCASAVVLSVAALPATGESARPVGDLLVYFGAAGLFCALAVHARRRRTPAGGG